MSICKNGVVLFHILDEQELKLNFNERTQFVDLETKETITTDPWHIKDAYKKEIQDFCDYFKFNCRKNKIDYIQIFTNENLDEVVAKYLLKRNIFK